MDKLYVGDIPSEYHFARFGNNYIDLFNTNVVSPNSSYDYYRVYLYDNMFAYDYITGTTGYNNIVISNVVETTDNIMYRRDMPSIIVMTFMFVIMYVFLINLVTSAIRRGGIFGGLI